MKKGHLLTAIIIIVLLALSIPQMPSTVALDENQPVYAEESYNKSTELYPERIIMGED